MKDVPLAGSLVGVSVPHLLSGLARAGRNGRLSLTAAGETRLFFVERGRLILDGAAVPDPALLDRFRSAGLLPESALDACATRARLEGLPLLRTAVETAGARPEAAWRLLEEEFKARLFALFDRPVADYDFEAGQAPSDADVLALLPLLPLLGEGIRRMANNALIRDSLPPGAEILQVIDAPEPDRAVLEPHERYLLLAIGKGRSLDDLRLRSRLGPAETDRTLFLLLCLGLIGRLAPKDPTGPGRELSPSEFDRMMDAFRDKTAAVFKYISKELGPFARTVLGKALEEVKPVLGSMFESVELAEDGLIEFKSPLKININLLTEDSQAELARGLTEILSAEVLAVKKSLGNDHEAALVKILEKVGEWN
jgi:hypothetical protein